MLYLLTKYAVSALLLVLISELAKRSTLLGAVLASLPLVTVIAMVWIWAETRDTGRIAALSVDIAWLVPPSLALFLVLTWLINLGWGFWPSLGTGSAATVLAYASVVYAIRPAFDHLLR